MIDTVLYHKKIKTVIPWRSAAVVLVLFISTYCYAEIKYEPEKELAEAKNYFSLIEKQRELQAFYPHRHYYNAKVYYDTAKFQLDEERNQTLASFYAVLALAELKTMHTIAMTRQMHNRRLRSERDQYKVIAERGTIRNRRKAAIAGSMLKQSDGKYNCVIPDYIIFKHKSDDLTEKGIEILNKIGMVIAINPSSRISIKGVTKDKAKIPEIIEKTKKISLFLHKEKRIGTNRIISSAEVNKEFLSIGTYKINFNRIEIVVTGIR